MKETFKEFQARFNKELFDEYLVTLDLVDIAGGIPADPDLIKKWIDKRNEELTDEARQRLAEATKDELPALAAEEEARSWTRFKYDENGPYIEGRILKSAIKECGNILKGVLTSTKKKKKKKGETEGETVTEKGISALKKRLSECVFVVEDKVYLQRNGVNVAEVPTEERPVHAITPQGPINALKREDVLADVSVTFTVRLAKTGAVSEEALFASLDYIRHNGLGASRSQGRGRGKDMDVVKIERE